MQIIPLGICYYIPVCADYTGQLLPCRHQNHTDTSQIRLNGIISRMQAIKRKNVLYLSVNVFGTKVTN